MWIDKDGYGVKSSAGVFKKQYYCPYLDAYVTDQKSCEIMTKLSGNVEVDETGSFKISCGKGKVIMSKLNESVTNEKKYQL